MSIERPKILSVITIPTGGWDVQVKLSNAGAYDVTVNATMAAGDYFLSGDLQSDDFLRELCAKLTTAIQLTALASGFVYGWIDSNHKVNLHFVNCSTDVATRPVKIVWTASDWEIPAALGFEYAADDILNTDPLTVTADNHQAYGWYCDGDGWLESKPLVDTAFAKILQSVSLSGLVKTQKMSSMLYESECRLAMVPNINALSDGIGYNATATYPASKNQPFECMWRELVQGKRFRFYRNYTTGTDRKDANAVGTGYAGAVITTAATNTADRWNGRQIFNPGHTLTDALLGNTYYKPYSADIADTAAANITARLPPGIVNLAFQSNTQYLIDAGYKTYVLKSQDARFAPQEVAGLDLFDIEFQMMRYVAP